MKRCTRRSGSMLLVLALLLAACGTDDTVDGDADRGDDGTTSVPTDPEHAGDTVDGEADGGDDGTTSVPADPEDASDPVPGGSLRYGTYLEGTGFDPATRGGYHGSWAIYDTLMRLDDSGEAEPYLAESLESDDLQLWTMTLRDGVEFHDGTPLDAEAVVFNIERHMDPASGSAAFAQTQVIESMEVVDDLTMRFTLKYPVAPFPVMFTGVAGMIASPTAVEEHGADYGLNPVGAGPFEFVEWLPDERTVLRKNENYWQEGLPYLDELVLVPRPDTQTRQDSILTGDTDVTLQQTPRELRSAEESPDVKMLVRSANGAEGILLNVTQPPFDDLRMRQMMAHSLNYDVISDVRFGSDMIRAYSPIGEDSPLFRDLSDVYPGFDPDAARAIIDEYVAEGGDPNFTFSAPNTPDRIQFGEMVQQFWADLGLEVELEFLDITEYVARILQQSDFQAAINTMPTFAHPYPNLFNNLHSASTSNFGRYQSAEMDELLIAARASGDPTEEAELWGEVQSLMAEDLPWVWYARTTTAFILRNNVHGVHFTLDGIPYFNETWVEQ